MQNKEKKIELIRRAAEMLPLAYVPYSHFHVGAALLGSDGKIYTGCNIENASYGATNCAERTALFKAVSEGCRSFQAIAIVGGMDGEITNFTPPCGICRQALEEFCDSDGFEVILARPGEVKTWLLKELLPLAFSGDNLETTEEKTGEI